MGAFRHMNGDHLLRDSCSWEAYDSKSVNSSSNTTKAYSDPVTLRCFVGSPSRRWDNRWPDSQITDFVEVWLPHDSTVAVKDKITHDGKAYQVEAVEDWQGACFITLCSRIEGATT